MSFLSKLLGTLIGKTPAATPATPAAPVSQQPTSFLNRLWGRLKGQTPATQAPPITQVPVPADQREDTSTPFPDISLEQEEGLRDTLGGEGGSDFLPPNVRSLLEGDWIQMASSNVEAMRFILPDNVRQDVRSMSQAGWREIEAYLSLAGEGVLEVEFKNGSFYQYFEVPYSVAERFMMTSSPGRYVWNFLRDIYPYVRLTGPSTVKATTPYPREATVVRIRWDQMTDWTQAEKQEAVRRRAEGEPFWVPARFRSRQTSRR